MARLSKRRSMRSSRVGEGIFKTRRGKTGGIEARKGQEDQIKKCVVWETEPMPRPRKNAGQTIKGSPEAPLLRLHDVAAQQQVGSGVDDDAGGQALGSNQHPTD